MASWDSLRREARRLENEVDAKLVAYSKLGLANSNASSPVSSASDGTLKLRGNAAGGDASDAPGAADHMAIELEALLVRLSETVDAMGRALHAASAPPAPSMTHILERHNEILNDYKNEFRKAKGSLLSAKEHQDLLSSVRQDMVKRGLVAGANGDVYAERTAIAGATSAADGAMNQGLSLREELERQRAMFASMVDRMEAVGESVPSINRLIGQIRRKRKRDVYIFAAVVATFTFITIIWKIV